MAAAWDERLIPRQRAHELVAHWPVRAEWRNAVTFLLCDRCSRAITELIPHERVRGHLVSIDGLVAAVLRHMVMAHDQSLSGGDSGRSSVAGPGEAGAAPVGRDGGGGGGGDGAAADRSADQEGRADRVGAAAGGGGT